MPSPLPPRPRARSARLVSAAVALAAIGALLTGCSYGAASVSSESDTPPFAVPGAEAPRSIVADRLLVELDGDEDTVVPVAELADSDWLDATSEATDIPRRALQAYAGVSILLAHVDPACGVGWPTLAGIGRVESHHGTIFGGTILGDGVTSEPIFGVPLDGSIFDAIPDHDGGAIDGVTDVDRAVGPMQIIPATWMTWSSDGGGGLDIHNIDDATLTAARYLCYSGGDLTNRAGWTDAIAGYNPSESYARAVADAANDYSDAAGR